MKPALTGAGAPPGHPEDMKKDWKHVFLFEKP
jgi:hypothetical protein